MCFSMEADLAIGAALLPVAALSLREVRQPREVPFAILPGLFAVHQLIEAAVWAAESGDVSAALGQAATLAYLLIALPLLPLLVPLAVLLLEPPAYRRRVSGFVVLGGVVSAYLLVALLSSPVEVEAIPWALEYDAHVRNGLWWAVLYVVAVIGPSLLSGYRSIVAFGAVNLLGLLVVAALYVQAFASLWCVLAAISSAMVLLHMHRRRHLPEQERLTLVSGPTRGEP